MKVGNFWKLLNLLVIIAAFTLTGCDDDEPADSGAKATLKMNLTDAPAAYDAVLVDIQQIEVHTEADGWINLVNIKTGIYNLLDFTNGLDTLIAEGEVPPGKISQIRLILGPGNTVVENGVSYPLKTPSGQQSGIKLNVHHTLEPGLVYEFWLDFDANRSVVKKGNGGYNLKPVIRVFTKTTTGSIEGVVDPVAAEPMVMAYNTAGDTAVAYANDSTGYFLLTGLPAAGYTVEFDPVAPFIPKTETGVNVTVGQITDMGVVVITQ